MIDSGTYSNHIVTRYLADTTKFEGTSMSPVTYIDSEFVRDRSTRNLFGSTKPPKALPLSTATMISMRCSCSSDLIPSGRTTCAARWNCGSGVRSTSSPRVVWSLFQEGSGTARCTSAESIAPYCT